LEGLLDITAILGPGVFLLWNHGRVTYVGKARCLLAGIAARRALNRADLPTWVPIPRIIFDRIEIIPCDTTRAIVLAQALIALHNPSHNRHHHKPSPLPPPPPPTPTHFPVRRI
jgi:excinuclease UvrABC nuclease subunit